MLTGSKKTVCPKLLAFLLPEENGVYEELIYLLHGAGYYLKSWLLLSFSKKILLLHGTRGFIIAFTKARHWTLSLASRIQFAPSIPISLRSILMLSFNLRLGLPSDLLPLGHLIKTSKPRKELSPPHSCCMTSSSLI
jgi:hypothetical protein